jgi:hypothetical protein
MILLQQWFGETLSCTHIASLLPFVSEMPTTLFGNYKLIKQNFDYQFFVTGPRFSRFICIML